MAGKPGFRINQVWHRPSTDLVAAFREICVANIGDAMNRLGILGNGIAPTWLGASFAGSALTVWTRAGDNLVVHKAINIAQPGDVLVINGEGDSSRALLGELMGQSASVLGIVGIVVDGAVRDVAELERMKLPVFARAVSPAGPFKEGPGEVGYPVACGGVVCAPGDVVVGDRDGVVVVPQSDAQSVLGEARGIAVNERRRRAEIAQGAPERSGIDEQLIRAGVIDVAKGSVS